MAPFSKTNQSYPCCICVREGGDSASYLAKKTMLVHKKHYIYKDLPMYGPNDSLRRLGQIRTTPVMFASERAVRHN